MIRACMLAVFFLFGGLSFPASFPDYGDISDLYISAYKQGETLKENGDYKEAVRSFEKGFAVALGRKDMHAQLECLMNLGLLFWNMGKMEESAERYQHALSMAQSIQAKSHLEKCRVVLEIYSLYSDAKSFRARGKLENAVLSFEQAIRLSRKYNSREHELKCLRQMSTVIWQMSRFEEFLKLNEQALVIAKQLNHRREEGKIFNHKGLYHWKKKDYSKALSYYQKSLDIAREYRDKEAESSCLNNLGLVYKDFGYFDRSLKMLKEALEIDRSLGNPTSISADLNNIGSTYIRKFELTHWEGALEQALMNFRECLELIKKTNNKRHEMHVLNNMGSVYLRKKEHSKAQHHFERSLELAFQLGDKSAQGMILNNMGMAYLYLDELDQAELQFKKAIDIAEYIQDRDVLWETYFGLGQGYEKAGLYDEAVICYQNAVDVIDSLRNQIALDTYKARFIQHKLQIYEHLIALLYQKYSANFDKKTGEDIFHLIERAKARSFLDMLGESRFFIRERLGEELKQLEESLSRQIAELNQRMIQNSLSSVQRKEIMAEMESREEEYMRLLSRMRTEIPEVADLMHPKTCSLQQVQQTICDQSTAVVEYFLGDLASYMFVVTQDSFRCYRLPPQTTIKDSIKAYLKILSYPTVKRFKHEGASKRIYNELFKNADALLPDEIKTVVIVPDGILYYLPFEALIRDSEEESKNRDWMIEKYTITYSPSMSSLLYLQNRSVNGETAKTLLALGNPDYFPRKKSLKKSEESPSIILQDLYASSGFLLSPLPFAEKEIKHITQFFPQEKLDIYLRKRAQETVIKNIPLEEYRIVHFACHALLDRRFPFRSALVLSLNMQEGEDGFLHVREIYNLRFRADLIVLSACQTGMGRLEKGEGILGLPRIFFYTGARSILSTLWKIDDRTSSRFMDLFYRHLSKGLNKASALRQAKLHMLRSPRSHPFFWAAFVINGEWESKISFQ